MKNNLRIKPFPTVVSLLFVLFSVASAFCQVKNKENLPSTPSGVFSVEQDPGSSKPSQANNIIIKYHLKNATEVSLKVYNLLGKEVATLVSQKQNPGFHSALFNGASLSEGVYYYQIKIEGVFETKRIIISK
jgi:hypothetical protein